MKEMILPNKIIDKEVDEYTARVMDKIRDDKEFYETLKSLGSETSPLTQGVVKENIGKINDWYEDFLVCKNCPGYESCPKAASHTTISFKYENGLFKKQINFCSKEIEMINYDSRFFVKDFPNEWINASPRNLVLDNERKQAVKEFRSILKKEKSLLYLKGSIGVGKSYIAAALVNEYINRVNEGKVAFVSCSDLFKALADKDHSYKEEDKQYFKRVIDILSSVSFLVLDGFGNEIKSTFIRDAIIFPLLSARKRDKLPTIITSNYSVNDIVEMYSFGKKTHPSAKMIGDTINYLSNNTEVEIKTINLFK